MFTCAIVPFIIFGNLFLLVLLLLLHFSIASTLNKTVLVRWLVERIYCVSNPLEFLHNQNDKYNNYIHEFKVMSSDSTYIKHTLSYLLSDVIIFMLLFFTKEVSRITAKILRLRHIQTVRRNMFCTFSYFYGYD